MLRQVCLVLAGLGIGGVLSGLVGGLAMTPGVSDCVARAALQADLAPWCDDLATQRARMLTLVPVGTLVASGGMAVLAFRILRRRERDDLRVDV